MSPRNDEGNVWLRRDELAALGLKCSEKTLWNWRTRGCPYLFGRRLRTKPDPRNKRRHLFWKADVLDIIAAMKGHVAPDPIQRFFSTRELRLMGVDVPRTLANYPGQDHRPGWRMRSRAGVNGKNRRYHIEDVRARSELLKAGHSVDTAFRDGGGRTWIPGPLLGRPGGYHFSNLGRSVRFPPRVLHVWHVRGCNLLGRKLPERTELALCGDGSHRPVHFYPEDELEEIEKARAATLNEDRIYKSQVLQEFPTLTWYRIRQAVDAGLIDRPYPTRVPVQFRSGITIQKKMTLSRAQLRMLAESGAARPSHKAGARVADPDVATKSEAVAFLGLATGRQLRDWSTAPMHPTAKRNHRKNKRKKPRGYRTIDGRLLVIRAEWRLIGVKGFRRHALFYRWDDLRKVKDAQDAWAAAVAMEPYVFPNDPEQHRWHRLERLAYQQMADLISRTRPRRGKNKRALTRSVSRQRYNALLARLKSFKPAGRPWHIKKVPGSHHWMRLAIREDELPILFPQRFTPDVGQKFRDARPSSGPVGQHPPTGEIRHGAGPVNETPSRRTIAHGDALAMLKLGGNLTAKEESRMMERVRLAAGDRLRSFKAGNRFQYDLEDWLAIVREIRALGTKEARDDTGAVKNFTDPPPLEIENQKAQIRASKGHLIPS